MTPSKPTDWTAVGAEIRHLRVSRGLTLREMGTKAGLEFSFLGRVERGHTASAAAYDRIASALGSSLSELLAASAAPKRPRRRAFRPRAA